MSLQYFAGFYCNAYERAEQDAFEHKLKLIFCAVMVLEIAWWITGARYISSKPKGLQTFFHIFMVLLVVLTPIVFAGIAFKYSPHWC